MTEEKKVIDKIIKVCGKGDLEGTKLLIKEANIDFSQDKNLNTAKRIYKTACFSANLSLIDELMYLTDCHKPTSFIKSIVTDLIDSKQTKYYPVISYLVNEPKLEAKRSPPERVSEFYGSLNFQIEMAASKDNLPLMKSLLNTHEPEKRNKWIFNTNSLFKILCRSNSIEIFQYLYSEPKFKNVLNPLVGLVEACRVENKKALQFLIFDYKIEKSEEIETYLRKTGNKDILKMLEVRDLNEELTSELQPNCDTIKRIKL